MGRKRNNNHQPRPRTELERAMMNREMTAVDLSLRSGVRIDLVYRYLSGDRRPPTEKAIALARAVKRSVSTLFS